MRRWVRFGASIGSLFALVLATGPTSAASASGELSGSNGAVSTTTLAAYHDGVEHYVTAFKFLGGGGQYGTLIPLPAIPTKVERGGAWTLRRLARETHSTPTPISSWAPRASNSWTAAGMILQTRVDALDLTILKGDGHAVADWAYQHGFSLSPDAPEVLEFYAQRSPIFLVAVFDGDTAEELGQQIGDGTPVQVTIPVSNPWVPLRILGLGKRPKDTVDADVFLLTDRKPALLPGPERGLALTYDAAATKQLLDDLRKDDGMDWLPQYGWLTELSIDVPVSNLKYDLAVDASGLAKPSFAMAGLPSPLPLPILSSVRDADAILSLTALVVLGVTVTGLFVRLRRARSGHCCSGCAWSEGEPAVRRSDQAT